MPLRRSTAAGFVRFCSAIGEPKKLLVSVGRYALRGVGKPQDLYTLDVEREKTLPVEDDDVQ